MARRPKAAEVDRRIPQQQRAQESCAAILAATVELLRREGVTTLSTNRIAQQAGLSVGTLYQYFPNKHAVLLALGRREVERLREVSATALAEAGPGADAGPRALRALLQALAARRSDRQVLCETLFHADLQAEVAEVISLTLPELAGRTEPEVRFVLTRGVLGVLRAVVLDPAAPDPAAVERELLALARWGGARGTGQDGDDGLHAA